MNANMNFLALRVLVCIAAAAAFFANAANSYAQSGFDGNPTVDTRKMERQ